MIGTALLRLANADILPFEFSGTAATLRGYVEEIEKLRKDVKDAPPWRSRCVQSDRRASPRPLTNYEPGGHAACRARRGARPRQADRVEPAALHLGARLQARRRPAQREWFKHLAYAPGFYTGYGVKTLPGIREAIEQRAWDEPRKFIPIVVSAINKLAAQVDQAAALLAPR